MGRSDGGLAENPGVVQMGRSDGSFRWVPHRMFLGVPGSFLSVLLFPRSTQTVLKR